MLIKTSCGSPVGIGEMCNNGDNNLVKTKIVTTFKLCDRINELSLSSRFELLVNFNRAELELKKWFVLNSSQVSS